jgi:hypothetical protein
MLAPETKHARIVIAYCLRKFDVKKNANDGRVGRNSYVKFHVLRLHVCSLSVRATF